MEEQENLCVQEENKKKKKKGRSANFVLGAVLGGVFSLALVFAGTQIYCGLTGDSILIGSGRSQDAFRKIFNDQTIKKVRELVGYVDTGFYEAYDEEKLRDNMYKGLISGIGDKYSVYYTAEEYQDLQVSTSGTYHGIGAGMTQDATTKEVTITKVYEGTPSEQAGLKNGDVVRSVNGEDASSVELSELVKRIRGEEGTKVTLEIYRPSEKKEMTIEVERKNVELPSVEAELLEGNIGYIQILEFQKRTANQFHQKLELLQEQGMESMIIDVRGNPGGMLDAVVAILDEILPEGLLVYTEDKYGKRNQFYSDKKCLSYPMVVLMDQSSASASEIFAGAIKDYAYGTLVGKKTFGKGIVQSLFPLSDGDALKHYQKGS